MFISFFLIDASHSMVTTKNLGKIKGMLLENVRQKKISQYFALVIMEHNNASIHLPFNRDLKSIQKTIKNIQSSGKTNLVAGFTTVATLLEKHPHKTNILLYILTDGRANIGGAEPLKEAISFFNQQPNLNQIDTTVIDTEIDFVKLKKSQELAKGIGAKYLHQINT